MGAAHSTDGGSTWKDFVPRQHLLRLTLEDKDRLFVPVENARLLALGIGEFIEIIDSFKRSFEIRVEYCGGGYFLGAGWSKMLVAIGCTWGDRLLFKFRDARTCKMTLFDGQTGSQKFPSSLENDRVYSTSHVRTGVFNGGKVRWNESLIGLHDVVHVDGCCEECGDVGSASGTDFIVQNDLVFNATGKEIPPEMLEFFKNMSTTYDLECPLYYFTVGASEAKYDFVAIDKEYGRKYVCPMMADDSVLAQLVHPLAVPLTVRLYAASDGTVVVSGGWNAYVSNSMISSGAECVFHFDTSHGGIRIIAYDF